MSGRRFPEAGERWTNRTDGTTFLVHTTGPRYAHGWIENAEGRRTNSKAIALDELDLAWLPPAEGES